jgi:hypothetical protein
MEYRLYFLKTSFDDFYGSGNTNIKEYKESKYTVTITPTDQNVYVHNCVFHYCLSSSAGGALYCGSSVYKLLVEHTTFISCIALNGHGGAIYFSSTTNGECIVSRTCGINCSSTNTGHCYGQFIYTQIKNDVTYKNHVNDSSFAHLLNSNVNTYEAFCLYYGKILLPSVNLTNNMCYGWTILYCSPVTGTGSPVSETFCMSYSSVVNNTANGGNVCLSLQNSASSQRIDTCNIMNNKQTTSGCGTIYAGSNLLIKDSCILGNNERNKVFYTDYSSVKITISNCTIDDDIFTKGRYSGSVTVIKTITKSFINALSHIVTQHCDSYFDSYGTLSAKPNVPSKTARNLMSYNCQRPMIDALKFLQFLFLLTFLPSSPANDCYFDFSC